MMPTEMQNVIDRANAELNRLKTERVDTTLNELVMNAQMLASEVPKARARALQDDSYLDELKNRPQMAPPGHAPLDFVITMVNEDMRNVFAGIQKHLVKGPTSIANAQQRSTAIGSIYRKERDRIVQVLNAGTNTVSTDLKRVVILQETIRAFAIRLLPLRRFSTVFSNVPLQGTDEIVVPYFPLQTAASSNWSAETGYVFSGTTNTGSKKITVNKRKYQPLDYSSEEFRRQPYLDVVRLGAMNAEKLGKDVYDDVLSVVTLANYGPAVKTCTPEVLTSDDIVDLRRLANAANWPDEGRSLTVNSDVDGSLSKDEAYKLAHNFGGSEVIREGRFPRMSGFDYAWASLPSNAENLIGFTAFASAILSAFCPVDPAPGVRAQLVAYEIMTDAQTGISFNYRHWGDADGDRDKEIIECAYGYEPGQAEALMRLVSAPES